ncbi:hypothetical protein ILUMI_26400 [Ignelater luminosus]|uniref:Ubiquinone biosynthesis O-methyltransferase, mitochondrial n=1 Tax=Ignelater luminosus TaxID=2038154 RepID=A0A8K0C4E5_IGNLU|nr:hypothetical protein ILUMI_26400 [Ignelater luminosus]
MATSYQIKTADPKELQNFKELSATWWDENGDAKPLHSMNKVRIELIKDGGILSEALAQLGCTVTGIDLCEELITTAKTHAELNPTLENLTYLHESIEEHNIKNSEKYDVIVASEVIDHVKNPFVFLQACVKCLKPGGSIFVTTFNKTLLSWLAIIIVVEYIWGLLPRGTHSWNKFISPNDVSRMLEQCACETKRVRGMAYNVLTNSWFWSRITSVTYALHAVKK